MAPGRAPRATFDVCCGYLRLSGFRDELTLVEFSFDEPSLLEVSFEELSFDEPSFEDPSFDEASFAEPSDLDFSSFFESELPPSEDAGGCDLFA